MPAPSRLMRHRIDQIAAKRAHHPGVDAHLNGAIFRIARLSAQAHRQPKIWSGNARGAPGSLTFYAALIIEVETCFLLVGRGTASVIAVAMF